MHSEVRNKALCCIRIDVSFAWSFCAWGIEFVPSTSHVSDVEIRALEILYPLRQINGIATSSAL